MFDLPRDKKVQGAMDANVMENLQILKCVGRHNWNYHGNYGHCY